MCLLMAMVELGGGENVPRQQLMEKTGFSSAMINRYQERLKAHGVIFPAQPGGYTPALSMFGNFVQEYYME